MVENTLWNETPNIFVAFLDIMGFRDRIFRNSHADVRKMLDLLRPTIEGLKIKAENKLKYQREIK